MYNCRSLWCSVARKEEGFGSNLVVFVCSPSVWVPRQVLRVPLKAAFNPNLALP